MREVNQGTLKILSNKRIDDEHFILSFDRGDLNPEAGQFIMIDCISQEIRNKDYKCGSHSGPLLKRPFSFYMSDNSGELSILYKVKEGGRGTGLLPNLKPDDKIYYRGPLGNPVDIENICSEEEVVHLVAGGVGIAPITFLAQKLIQVNRKVQLYFGFSRLDDFAISCLDNLNDVGVEDKDMFLSMEEHYYRGDILVRDMTFTPEEKYRGIPVYKGNICQAFNNSWLGMIRETKGLVFICAPYIVMKYLNRDLLRRGLNNCFTFMEERMACGIGVCKGCDVNGKSVCQDGPCLNSKDVFKEE